MHGHVHPKWDGYPQVGCCPKWDGTPSEMAPQVGWVLPSCMGTPSGMGTDSMYELCMCFYVKCDIGHEGAEVVEVIFFSSHLNGGHFGLVQAHKKALLEVVKAMQCSKR